MDDNNVGNIRNWKDVSNSRTPSSTEMPTTVVTRNVNSRRNTNGGSRHKRVVTTSVPAIAESPLAA
jgi:hypothetical protein